MSNNINIVNNMTNETEKYPSVSFREERNNETKHLVRFVSLHSGAKRNAKHLVGFLLRNNETKRIYKYILFRSSTLAHETWVPCSGRVQPETLHSEGFLNPVSWSAMHRAHEGGGK